MAYTLAKAETSVYGNHRVWHGVVTADAATGVVSFGLSRIINVSAAPKSCATNLGNLKINELAAGTASVGSLGISGVTSGDDFYLTVYGT